MTRRPRTPNVIVILVDTLRGDRVSYAGHARATSPRLDALAGEAVVYPTAISPGAWTPPSHASIFTGTYPARHGVDRSHPYLDTPMTTLPEYLHERGYRTYGISSNYWISAATHYDRGFDVFCQSWQLFQTRTNPALERQRRRDPSYTPPPKPALLERLQASANRLEAGFWRTCCGPLMPVDMGAGRVNRVVRRWVRRWATEREPFFAFIHYMEPHLPYHPPTQFARRFLGARELGRARAVNQNALKFIGGGAPMAADDFELLGRLYDAEINYTDHCIGELLDGLRATGLLDDTLLVFTSDHGENLGDHGLMDHMFSVHDSIVRVPLLVRFPGGRPRGVERGLVQTLDIFPTVVAVLEDAGVSANGAGAGLAAQFQGTPLPPLGAPRDYAVSELRQVQPPIATLQKRYPGFDWRVYDRSLHAVRTVTHKFVRGSNGTESLYDLAADPGETTDRLFAEPAIGAAMRARLAAWQGSFTAADVGEPGPELDDEIRRRLADLGYLED
jgi:arylsulfatase A-like enzyme